MAALRAYLSTRGKGALLAFARLQLNARSKDNWWSPRKALGIKREEKNNMSRDDISDSYINPPPLPSSLYPPSLLEGFFCPWLAIPLSFLPLYLTCSRQGITVRTAYQVSTILAGTSRPALLKFTGTDEICPKIAYIFAVRVLNILHTTTILCNLALKAFDNSAQMRQFSEKASFSSPIRFPEAPS